MLPPGTVARLPRQNGPVPNKRLYAATGRQLPVVAPVLPPKAVAGLPWQNGPVPSQRLYAATGRQLPVVALPAPMAGSLRKRAALAGALSPTCP